MFLSILFKVPCISNMLQLRYKRWNQCLILHCRPRHFEIDMCLDIVTFTETLVKLWMTQLCDEKLGRRVKVQREMNLRLEDAEEDLVVGFAGVSAEGSLARKEFVDEDTEGPPVHHLSNAYR